MTVPTLETERLVLRPMRADDADALHAIYSDEAAMTYWSSPPHTALEETRARTAENVTNQDWGNWAITLKGDDRAIGMLAAHEKRQGRVVEIGYALVRANWRQGLAREATSRLIEHLFHDEGVRRIFADTDPDNVMSNRLLEALGFVLEGRLRGEWQTHIGVRDSYIWGLLANEWRG